MINVKSKEAEKRPTAAQNKGDGLLDSSIGKERNGMEEEAQEFTCQLHTKDIGSK